MDSAAVPSESAERVFGRYRLVQIIGEGGMAVVYDALIDGPRGFARRCVVKRIRPELSSDPYFVDMLATEARLCGLLRHPNIVQTFDFGEVSGEFFLAMEHVEGHDLTTVLGAAHRRGYHPGPGVVAYVTYELARALSYAHSLSDDTGHALDIVHRDVSPSNVMLSDQGAVRLLDFGIAKATAKVRDEETRTGTLKGKLGYMSPEQADGLPIDRRSDIFALGVVAHELSTVKRLFKGDNDLHTLRLIRETRVEPPSRGAPHGNPDLDRIILKMLAQSPDARFQSCDEIVAELEPLVRRLQGDGAATRQFLGAIGPIENRNARPLRGEPRRVPADDELTTANGARADLERRTPTLASGELRSPGTSDIARQLRPSRAPWYVVTGAVVLLASAIATVVARTPRAAPHRDAQAATVHALAPGTVSGPVSTAAKAEATSPKAGLAAPRLNDVPEPHPSAMAAPTLVRLRVNGPVGAEVRVDSNLVGLIPVDTQLPTAPEHPRLLSVSMPGYDRWTRTIAGDATVSLTVPLRKIVVVRRSVAPERPSAGRPVIKDPFK